MVTRWTGYAMAATFFALSHAMTRGAHIRVSINESILKLVMAGIFSGLVIAALFMSDITVTSCRFLSDWHNHLAALTPKRFISLALTAFENSASTPPQHKSLP